ncbi:MAG: hypothetical protein DWB56_10655 [Candidatus Jettenia sp.]|nr:MAG: hypothetical protein EDM77_14680 [Candidatus Jettenia sp. AMX1]MBC6929405.1 hypothetical protein [Candidatus Jettenia sp.]MCE7880806.1 hypothetical protein [Candidatus Jettenia sp. AMX1]MCQ3927590.1 hypothetical protein [Candidatus Jettenia sp.]
MSLSIFIKGMVKVLRGCLRSAYSCLEFIHHCIVMTLGGRVDPISVCRDYLSMQGIISTFLVFCFYLLVFVLSWYTYCALFYNDIKFSHLENWKRGKNYEGIRKGTGYSDYNLNIRIGMLTEI